MQQFNDKEFVERFGKEFYGNLMKALFLSTIITFDLNEEQLVQALSDIKEKKLTVDVFEHLEEGLVEQEKYELANVIKTYISYNYEQKAVTKNRE